jgi:glycosyltransferase involved in cell wall biosynthesis
VPEEITLSLYRALTDDAFRVMLDGVPDAGFDWPTAAERLARVYAGLRADVGRRRARRDAAAIDADREVLAPFRLAVVTPLPPTPSGVATHSDRLLRAMHGFDDVEVAAFVAAHASGYDEVVPYPVHELATLPARWALGEFDAVLHCFGNHEFHRPYLPMLRLVPGAALLHDVRLTGVYPPERPVHDQTALGAGPIARAATRVLVQSAHAAALLHDDAGVEAFDVGPHHCPAVPPVTDDSRRGSAERWVVSAGIADPSKRTDLIVDAARRWAGRPDVRVAVVGLGGDAFDPGDDSVVVTGPVDDAAFDAWLRRASVVVQLRATTNGESSGVVHDALARGCPVVVSRLGSMDELPDDVVVKVDVDVTAAALADVIDELLADDARRAELSANALAFAAEHTVERQARQIVDALRDG